MISKQSRRNLAPGCVSDPLCVEHSEHGSRSTSLARSCSFHGQQRNKGNEIVYVIDQHGTCQVAGHLLRNGQQGTCFAFKFSTTSYDFVHSLGNTLLSRGNAERDDDDGKVPRQNGPRQCRYNYHYECRIGNEGESDGPKWETYHGPHVWPQRLDY